MNNKPNKTTPILPKLRFPEFSDKDDWTSNLLENLYYFKITNSLSREKLNYENGSIKNIHYGDIHTKFSTLFDIEREIVPFINPSEPLDKIKPESYCVEGDLIFADASEDIDDVGKSIEIINLNNEKLLSGLHTLLARQIHGVFIIGFIGYLFKSNQIRKQIKKESQGVKVLGISARRLLNVDISYPSDKKEQQKIADCLSSLDDLISTQTQKLTALEQHKKGLMQTLFPADGKTTPKLRFPEFQNVGEWEDKKLGDVGKVVMCKRVMKSETTEVGKIPFYKIGTFGKKANAFISQELYEEYKNKYSHPKKGDVLISASGTIGRLVVFDGLPSYFQDSNIVWIDNHEKLVKNYFLSFLYGTVKWTTENTTIARLYNNNLSNLQILIPQNQKEQQKIADCLSSLDELISTQSQKITTLAQHKKGLMQNLFPNNEVD